MDFTAEEAKTPGTGYQIGKTFKKGAPPFIVLILIHALKQALAQLNVDVSDDVLYGIALGGYGSVIAFINWIKNHKRKAASG